ASSRARITIQDILTTCQRQPVPQPGYQCASCSRFFPRLWSIKNHIQYSSQEGSSCKVYHRRLEAMWGKEHKEQGGCSP
ncbi:SPT46 protein, partial [Heliornis fulica]|nr:SPT46 protein [Heliornis fulica]